MKDVFTAKNPDQTQKIAARIAREISTNKRKKAVVIGLIGDLGSGKTVFAKGFAKGLGVKECVVSPTFVLERIYKLKTKNYKLFIHIDAYRIEKSKEIADLGFKDLIRDCRNIVLIEWADRIKNILPKGCIIVKFEHINKNKRKITIKNF
jgi:tRNA threonylcarbamoyladenosine biosynthesis protein TsaE